MRKRSTEKYGRTIDEAVELALRDLGVGKEEVEIEVLEEPQRGLLGIFGGRDAKVRVTVRPKPDDLIREFLTQVFKGMGVSPEFRVKYVDGQYKVLINDDRNAGYIIGKRGETLDALQYLTTLVINKEFDHYVRVLLDVGNYRKRRERTLQRLARRMAEKVKMRKRRVVLEPMNAMERRIIHLALKDYPGIQTYSEGQEPNRRVVIDNA